MKVKNLEGQGTMHATLFPPFFLFGYGHQWHFRTFTCTLLKKGMYLPFNPHKWKKSTDTSFGHARWDSSVAIMSLAKKD